jgi:hypothetical protein
MQTMLTLEKIGEVAELLTVVIRIADRSAFSPTGAD